MPAVVVTDGPLAGRRIEVDSRLLVGRVDADLTIDDELVSRRHARDPGRGGRARDRGSRLAQRHLGERRADRRAARARTGRRDQARQDLDRGRARAASTRAARCSPRSTRRSRPQPSRRRPPQRRLRRRPPARAPVVEPTPVVEPPPVVHEPEPVPVEPVPVAAEATPLPRRPAPMPVAAGARRATPRPQSTAEDELRPVTALFADIVGSTSLGERLASHEVKVVVGECVSRMTRVGRAVRRHRAGVHGRRYRRVLRAPARARGRPGARRAGRARDRRRRHATTRGRSKPRGASPTSTCASASTRARPRSAWSATPIRSRSRSATRRTSRRGCSRPPSRARSPSAQATAQSLLHAFVLEPLGELSVKGRDKPVEAWRLVCPQTAAQAAPLTPLVGRDEEVGRLQAVVDELTNGRGQMLFLLGDAGIGKTRLLAELRQLADRARDLAGGPLPLVRHRAPVRAARPDAARLGGLRGGRARAVGANEATSEARPPARVGAAERAPVPRRGCSR